MRSAALRDLTVNDRKLEWTDKEEEAFNDLKTTLVHPPILCYPHLDLPLYIETDACVYTVLAIFSGTWTSKVRKE